MTGYTQNRVYPYPVRGDIPAGPEQLRDLAEAVDADVTDVAAAAAAATTDAAAATATAEAAQHRVATTVRTTPLDPITAAETLVDTVTAAVTAGAVYRIRWAGTIGTDGGGTVARLRFRDGGIGGPAILQNEVYMGFSNRNLTFACELEWTAPATEERTFAATAVPFGGTGDVQFDANAVWPLYLYVDYIRG